MMHPTKTTKLESIFPEVIGTVITIGPQKRVNLCPINFQAVSTKYENPLSVCIGLSNESQTLDDILKNSQFVYSYPSSRQLKDVIYCGTVSGKTIDKLKETKLQFSPSKTISPPNLESAVLNFECVLKHHYNAGNFTIVIGEITNISRNKNSDSKKIYSLGGMKYGTIRTDRIIQEGR